MLTIEAGEKVDVIAKLSADTPQTLTNPERRIVDAGGTVVPGFDWGAATWDQDRQQLYASFDSTQVGLSTPGFYKVKLRGTIGSELRQKTITVKVI